MQRASLPSKHRSQNDVGDKLRAQKGRKKRFRCPDGKPRAPDPYLERRLTDWQRVSPIMGEVSRIWRPQDGSPPGAVFI
jgi:hypothetical protein